MNDKFDLTVYHTRVEDVILAHFGNIIEEVVWYRTPDEQLNTPCVILEMEDFKEGGDLGDDRTPVFAKMNAACVLHFETVNRELALRSFALDLFRLVRQQNWGLGEHVERAHSLYAQPGLIKPDSDGYASWFVSWEQTLYVGESVWDAQGVLPKRINVGPNDGTYDNVIDVAS